MPHGRRRPWDGVEEEATPRGQKCEQRVLQVWGPPEYELIGAANVCSEAECGGWDCVVTGLYIYQRGAENVS